jgi:DNA-nicking Smr family endonuclease
MGRDSRYRGLSDADRAAWEQVASTVTKGPGRIPVAKPAPRPLRIPEVSPPPAAPAPSFPRQVLRPVGSGAGAKSRIEAAPVLIDRLDPARGLDGRTADRVRRGKRAPEARLDLHGMTAVHAHDALVGFVRSSHARGLRFVLVITGKGGRRRNRDDAGFIPEGAGVLRHAVPRWLREAPMRPLVTAVYAAHLRHGGEGALYIQLSKRR